MPLPQLIHHCHYRHWHTTVTTITEHNSYCYHWHTMPLPPLTHHRHTTVTTTTDTPCITTTDTPLPLPSLTHNCHYHHCYTTDTPLSLLPLTHHCHYYHFLKTIITITITPLLTFIIDTPLSLPSLIQRRYCHLWCTAVTTKKSLTAGMSLPWLLDRPYFHRCYCFCHWHNLFLSMCS